MSLIVCNGGDCRREVSLHSYSPSNVELCLQNANFWGFFGDFSVGRDLLTFGGALLNTPRPDIAVRTSPLGSGQRQGSDKVAFLLPHCSVWPLIGF